MNIPHQAINCDNAKMYPPSSLFKMAVLRVNILFVSHDAAGKSLKLLVPIIGHIREDGSDRRCLKSLEYKYTRLV
jgi:hypothetical protein